MKTIKGQCLEYQLYNLCISMPKDRDSCQYCPCLKYENDVEIRRCKMTGEIVNYWKSERGERCPLVALGGTTYVDSK